MKKYGRGKFETHSKYIEYMHKIIKIKPYTSIPNLETSGKINWQVSSGKTTSFYKFYKERWNWWKKISDKLGLEGEGNGNQRFTIAARKIHPTKFKPCRLCGEDRYVGYFYLNKNAIRKINNLFSVKLEYLYSIESFFLNYSGLYNKIFPEFKVKNKKFIQEFKKYIHYDHKLLSPGYMGNPPDRLDGFHDYCVFCRQKNDPGRSVENLRMYNVDRRTFQYWVQGNWKEADQLFNLAGAGNCSSCNKLVKKISPDHVGPLSCGFKHITLFSPMCVECNTSKNRRMRYVDVKKLIEYENIQKVSVASIQIKKYWDKKKFLVKSDSDALFLSNRLRLIQHYWLLMIGFLIKNKRGKFLEKLLNFDCIEFNYSFDNLNKSNLTFSKSKKEKISHTLRKGQKERISRIAFTYALEYFDKNNRKIVDDNFFQKIFQENKKKINNKLYEVKDEQKISLFLDVFNQLVQDVLDNDPFYPKTLAQ